MRKRTSTRRTRGTGSLVEKSGSWYLRYQENGLRKMVKLYRLDGKPAGTKAEAEEAQRLCMGEILAAKSARVIATLRLEAQSREKRQRVPLSAIWREFEPSCKTSERTKKSYESYWKNYCEWAGEVMVDEVTPTMAEDYLEQASKGKSNQTFNQVLNCLSHLHRYAIRHGWAEKNPFADIGRRQSDCHSHKNFSESEVKLIFAWFDNPTSRPKNIDELKTLMTVCCWTGLRFKDAVHLRKSQADFASGVIRLTPEKTKHSSKVEVCVPMHSQLREELQSASFRDEEWFMPNLVKRYDKQNSGTAIGNAVQQIIRQALGVELRTIIEGRKLKGNLYGLHSFRHTFISFCANAGVSMEITKAMVGHTTDVTRVYTHISEKAMKSAISRLETDQADLRSRVASLLGTATERQLSACLAILEQ